jgi:flagellar biosynthesis protein FliR
LNVLTQQDLLGTFLVFCRVGTACMLLPGFAVARVPVLFRVLLAFFLSAAIRPYVQITWSEPFRPDAYVNVLFNELLVGLFFGFIAAIFVHAVRFSASFIMALIGLAGIPGQPIDDLEANPPFVILISMGFIALIFATDIHLLSFKALLATYDAYPLGERPGFPVIVETLGNSLRDTSLMALKAASPFILHSLGINFALGLTGKLTPQLQSYFALMGVSTLVALLVLYILGAPLLSLMIGSYADWLENGL